ncbi:hypothetical protein SLS58_010149 [Diplodia intermedia]|uniref:Integral membrane protein n=1 Tax=Diplodia intermedia TaxID=856260 RepID=A0ABR3T8K0_9PEZI
MLDVTAHGGRVWRPSWSPEGLDLPSPAVASRPYLPLTTVPSLFYEPNPINESWGWHLQFLTCCGLSLAFLTYIFALLADLTLSRALFRAKNLLALTSAPLECCISVLYWVIKAIDPRLLMHPDLPALDLLPDISFHLAPAVLLALDLLFFSPPWTLTATPAIAVSSLVAVGYWFWVEACFAHNGYYPYPLFGQLDTPARAVLFTGAAAIMTVSTLALKAVYHSVNGPSKKSARAGDAKKGS